MSDQQPENNNLIKFIAATVESMRDQMATKSDRAQLEERLKTKLKVEITAVRGDIEQVHLRLDSIERDSREARPHGGGDEPAPERTLPAGQG